MLYLLQGLLLIGSEWRQTQLSGGALSILHDERRTSLSTPTGEGIKHTLVTEQATRGQAPWRNRKSCLRRLLQVPDATGANCDFTSETEAVHSHASALTLRV